jgi:hypothetical protein
MLGRRLSAGWMQDRRSPDSETVAVRNSIGSADFFNGIDSEAT